MCPTPSLSRVRLALGVALACAAIAACAPGSADAMARPAADPSGVVSLVFGDLEYVWQWNLAQYGYAYRRPTIRYYGYAAGGKTVMLPTECATGNWTFGQYCARDGVLGLRWPDLTESFGRYGDGTAAFWLAHEFGHHVQALSSEDTSGRQRELEADCLAGVFIGTEVGWGRNLDHADAVEVWTQLSAQPWSSSHGSGTERAAAFSLGYTKGSWYACDAAY